MELREIGLSSKEASREAAILGTAEKNRVLKACGDALLANMAEIIEANKRDQDEGKANDMPDHILDRLILNEDRIEAMAEGLFQMVDLPDPIGEVISMVRRPNNLLIGKKRVPLGVIGIIYEARPNVTSDAFGLCFKAGNTAVLKGGSDAINSNKAIVKIMRDAIESCGVNPNVLLLIEDTSRETAKEFMKLNKYIDVLIPRGGAGLIKTVVENSTIPVIETGTGNCHVFVDEGANLSTASEIVINAKTQRPSVCNACESLLIHKSEAESFLPEIAGELMERGVELRCDERALAILRQKYGDNPLICLGTEEDWATEFLDNIISVNIVEDIDEAIEHINKYNTGHSESIVTNDYNRANQFLEQVDAACVYVNASTRFTDGFEFGFGGEIGISTQKLHARGPMGLLELTSYKYIVYGEGQVR